MITGDFYIFRNPIIGRIGSRKAQIRAQATFGKQACSQVLCHKVALIRDALFFKETKNHT